MTAKTIGDLNGKWSIVFRSLLVLVSIFIVPMIGLVTWLVVGQFELRSQARLIETKLDFFMGAGPRYTANDAEHDISKARSEIFSEIEGKYPPEWFKEQVESYGKRIEMLERER